MESSESLSSKPVETATAVDSRLPEGIRRIIDHHFAAGPESLNTDWVGTLPLFGLLRLQAGGLVDAGPFCSRWLDYHVSVEGSMSEAELRKRFGGNTESSRIFMLQPIPSSAYAGHFGIAHVGHELYRITGDIRARDVVISLADALLHDARRHRNGMIAHDDSWDRAIPDICFFVVETLMRAADLDPVMAGVYRAQALRQLRLNVQAFLDPDLGVARTMLFFPEQKVGRTFWSRATGWLAWSLVAGLRFLPPDHPEFAFFRASLERLASGVERAVDADGALHVHVDDHKTPQENTGTAMTAIALNEAFRKGWIDATHGRLAARMWAYNLSGLSDDGHWDNVYIKWALPAEDGETQVARVDYLCFGPSMGCLLWAAAEFLGNHEPARQKENS